MQVFIVDGHIGHKDFFGNKNITCFHHIFGQRADFYSVNNDIILVKSYWNGQGTIWKFSEILTLNLMGLCQLWSAGHTLFNGRKLNKSSDTISQKKIFFSDMDPFENESSDNKWNEIIIVNNFFFQVSLYNFELWLSNTGTVLEINKVLVTSLYNNDIKTNLIPKSIASRTSVLHSTQILYLSSLLPSVYRNQWRFLFSTRTHGESFSTMMRHILNQGPTLVIIKDSKEYIFGGFASDSWSTGPKFVGKFLFYVLLCF